MIPVKSKPAELPSHYYLDNFNCLIDFVFEHYEALLTEAERFFYLDFRKLPENSQRLYSRLLSRSGDYVRTSKLTYDEINNIDLALAQLHKAKFITDASTDYLSDWVSLFSKKELTSVLAVPAASVDIASSLLPVTDLFGTCPLDTLLDSERVIHILHQCSFTTFRLLFFGNLHQDLTTFVLRDLGVRKFESYLTDPAALPFQSRDQINDYLCYYQCTDHYETAVTGGVKSLIELHRQLPGRAGNDSNLNRRVDNFSNRIARQLERENELSEAAAIYQTNNQPPARERLARIAVKCDHVTEAINICQQIEQTPADAQEKEFALEFSARIARKAGIEHASPEKVEPAEILLRLPRSALPVEFVAALHFAKYGKCYYVENTLITGVFGLAFWDIIFAPIRGVFYHPFQSAPADIYDADFRQLRKNIFDKRFSEIHDGNLTKIVLTHFHTKVGIRNRFVQWPYLNRHLITHALKNIPLCHWINLFEYLLMDIRNHKSGLPDLIYFPDKGSYSLLEVKGPGDRLQKNQLRWMRYFEQCNIDHAVVYVEYVENIIESTNEDNALLNRTAGLH